LANEDLRVEYQELGRNMRVYVVQRYTQLTPFVALMTGLGAVEYASALQVSTLGKVFVALAGVLVSAIFLVLDRRSHWYWTRLYERSKQIETVLQLGQFTNIPAARGPFTATNAVLTFYVSMSALWLFALVVAGADNWQIPLPGWAFIVIGLVDVALSVGLAIFTLVAPGLRSSQ
jgi:hypothetical protein